MEGSIELAPSLINSIFKNGQVKVMRRGELIGRLKEMDIDHDDAEDII